MSGSIRFDRAAEIYDRTRAISREAMDRTTELLASELGGRGRVLEIGVGTGLLALPLHRAGVPLVGLDLTEAMVAKLVEKAGGRAFPLVLGDATSMPFADDVFGGAYLRWVLHLIPDWRRVLAETVRVVRPGGVFVAELGHYDETRSEVQRRFAEIAGVSIEPVGLDWADYGSLDAEMAGHRATLRILPSVKETWEDALGDFLDGIEQGMYSWTWTVPEDVRLRTLAELRPWAVERFGPLDEVRRSPLLQVWRAYDLSG